MDILLPGLIGAAISATACAVALIAAGLVGRWTSRLTAGRCGAAVGMGVGYGLGHAAVRNWYVTRTWPLFPPHDAFDWVVWFAVAGMVLGLFEAIWPTPAWARWENRLVLT